MMGKTVASDENVRLTAWLKEKRKEKGMTMRSLANTMNTPHSFVGKIEHQERRLDVVEFMRYCTALEVDPGEAIKVLSTAQ